MKIEMGIGGGMWSEEEKATVAAILGTRAFDYLISSSVSNENLLMTVGSDENLQNKLSDLVDQPNAANFSWNYAIFWQFSRSKSGDLVLGWGDGCCREPKEGEESEATRIQGVRFEDEAQQNMRKRVLQTLNTMFGGSDEENYALGLDRVTDTEMFFLASMYFSFPRGHGGPGRCIATGRHVWISDALKSSADYCVRSFLARSAGMQTLVLVPTDLGVVELGSVRSVPESIELLQLIASSFSSQTSAIGVKPAALLPLRNQPKDGGAPVSTDGISKIFGKPFCSGYSQFREKLAVRKVDDRTPWDIYPNGGRVPIPGARNGVHNSSWGAVHGMKQGSPAEVLAPQALPNHLQASP